MSAADLAFGRRVIWRGMDALIVDIRWRARRTQVQIRVIGGHLHWANPSELTEVAS